MLRKIILSIVVLYFLCNLNVYALDREVIKLGTSINIYKGSGEYVSTNKDVACVNNKGIVTAKKCGISFILIKRNGKVINKIEIKVVSNGNKPNLNVCADDLKIENISLSFENKNKMKIKTDFKNKEKELAYYVAYLINKKINDEKDIVYSLKIRLKNLSDYNVKKVILYGNLGEENDTRIVFNGIPKNNKKSVKVQGIIKQKFSAEKFILRKMEIYSENTIFEYDYDHNFTKYKYIGKDKKAPKIMGFVGENSYNGKIPYQTIYKNNKDNYNYFKYVKAIDDRDDKVIFTVDIGKVNFNKKGVYEIIYKAKDNSGNVSKNTAKIAVRTNETVDKIANQVLKKIIKNDWSDKKKAIAIYDYVKSNIYYTGNSDKTSWEKEAINGLRKGTGDCFTYYSTARILLTKAGIPNIEVKRVKGTHEGEHWWNMVYVNGSWWHFDTDGLGKRICLVTDEQLKEFSKNNGNSHIWDYNKVPKTLFKKISQIK